MPYHVNDVKRHDSTELLTSLIGVVDDRHVAEAESPEEDVGAVQGEVEWD